MKPNHSFRRQILVISVLAVLFIIAASPVIAAPVTNLGSVSLKSTPSGAAVYLDDVSKGVTPVTLKNIPAGTHSVVMKKAGYIDYKTSVTVVGGKTLALSVTLKPTVGSISIKSTPSGATVYLDNVKKGVTPITLSNIKTGDHTIVLKYSKYKDYQTKVTVLADKTTSVDATLVLLPQPFTISVTPTSTSARSGDVIPYTLKINGGEGLNEPIHLTFKASASGYSKTYDLGDLQPPFPTTITKSVTMPSGIPSGITITGTFTATGGGMTSKATITIKSKA